VAVSNDLSNNGGSQWWLTAGNNMGDHVGDDVLPAALKLNGICLFGIVNVLFVI
jgi:hypothetical protein